MVKKSLVMRLSAFLMAAVIAVPIFSDLGVYAANNDNNDADVVVEEDTADTASGRDNTYSDYYDKYEGTTRPNEEIVILGKDFAGATAVSQAVVKEVDGKEALAWEGQEGKVDFTVDIKTAGLYNIAIDYYAFEGKSGNIEFSLSVDGEVPYDTAGRITLYKKWVDKHPISTDSRDNQIRPPQVEQPDWQSTPLKDVDGLFNDPLLFYFEAGEHTISLESTRANFAISQIKLYNEQPLMTYDEYVASVDASVSKENTGEYFKYIEGERAAYKSDSTLYPTYDRTTYVTSPSHPVKMRYNTIGQGNWSKSGQQITWNMNVDADGWYKIGIRARQQDMRGFYSNRRLYIDGVVPCVEADQIKFDYGTDWETVSPQSASGEDLYFYFEAGRSYELTLEAIPGEIGDVMRDLDDTIFDLNAYYRRIIQITGPNPDEYNTYAIHRSIPSIIPDFQAIVDTLMEKKDYIEGLTGVKGSEAVELEKMAILLKRCIKEPDEIPNLLTQIKDNITAVSAWMRTYRGQPLELDRIEIASPSESFESTKSNFFKSMGFGFNSFIGSFTEDYNILSDEQEDSLNVWVALGRDQAQVVKEMVDSYFVPEYGTAVTVNLVQGGIVEATLAGKGPDIALFIGGDFPIQLAARDVLVDLSQFEDYEEVTGRFAEHAQTLYQYDGKAYGLPVSQNFPMMFYRTDILADAGFDAPPDTWTELVDMLPALQRKYMEVGLVLPPTLVSTTTEAGHTFAMMLLQQGVNYYNENQDATMFDTQEAVTAFETWTKFYTTYSFEQTYDAFTRFRTGEMPLLIQNYVFYNQLSVAAPEIKGLWNFTPVPGTIREDGTLSRAANSAGSGAIIFKKVQNQEKAWEFIKWFTSTDVQIEYGNTIEAVVGPMGRFDSANIEAIQSLSWSQAELGKINEQIEHLVEIPVIPASYAVTRNIMNAFRAVVNDADNARDTLLWYNRDIDAEILRKRQEIGLE